jgi:hypothetical protein
MNPELNIENVDARLASSGFEIVLAIVLTSFQLEVLPGVRFH